MLYLTEKISRSVIGKVFQGNNIYYRLDKAAKSCYFTITYTEFYRFRMVIITAKYDFN